MRTATAILMMVAACAWGQANFYTGTNSLIDAGFSNGSVFTVCGWAKLTTTNSPDYEGCIIESYGDNPTAVSSYGVLLRNRIQGLANYGVLQFAVFSGSSAFVATNNALTEVNRQYHVAGTYDRTKLSLYIDGVLVNQKASTAVPNVKPVYIGSIPDYPLFPGTSWSFSGDLADVRYYSRALSAAEIAEIYARPWALADDPTLILRTCIVTNDTGSTLTGTAPNYGTGANGTYSNSPTAAPWTQQFVKPRRATLP